MPSSSRRRLLKAAALAPVIAVVPVEIVRRTMPTAKGAEPAYAAPPEGHFTAAEIAFVDAAVARIIPNDELGPGAKEAGVTAFIDRQLAGPYGRAEEWYMHGPWRQGTAAQGYQLRLTPAQLYRAAIADIDDYVRKQHGKRFAELDAANQDGVLNAIDKAELTLPNVPARAFFEMLTRNTVEGFLADPLYGGNRDFIGWKLIGFPGPRYNYTAEIEQHGKRYEMPFVSIAGRDAGVRRA